MAGKEHYGWEVFLGTWLGAVATVALLGALVGLIWASAIGIGVQTPVIAGAAEARPTEGLISNESPVGQALLGKRVGDEVQLQVPKGLLKLTVRLIH